MKYGVTWEITPATDLNAFGQVNSSTLQEGTKKQTCLAL